jgi:adenine phosphoribosyltransferase
MVAAMDGTISLDDVRRRAVAAFAWIDGHADVASILRDAGLLQELGPALAAPFQDAGVTAVAAVEAKGFALGALVAAHLGCGMVLVRKEGAMLPGDCVAETTAPDWRDRRLVLHLRSGHVGPDDRVLVVDDWIETGAQAQAVFTLVRRRGAVPVGVAALVDDIRRDPAVRERLNVVGLLGSAELGPA